MRQLQEYHNSCQAAPKNATTCHSNCQLSLHHLEWMYFLSERKSFVGHNLCWKETLTLVEIGVDNIKCIYPPPYPISPAQITGNELDMNIAVSAEVNLVEFDKQTESPQTDKQTEHPLTVEISLYFFTFKTLDVWSDGKAVAPIIDRRWFILIDNGHQYLRKTKTVFPIRNVRMVWRKHLLL